MIIKNLAKTLLIILLFSFICSAQELPNRSFVISPGIKLGYTFGDNGGFTYGFEISFLSVDTKSIFNYGTALCIDRFNNQTKYHLGIEGLVYMGGIDIGPTIIVKDNQKSYGFSTTAFAGILLYPYLTYTRMYSKNIESYIETGGYIKFPFYTDGNGWNTIMEL